MASKSSLERCQYYSSVFLESDTPAKTHLSHNLFLMFVASFNGIYCILHIYTLFKINQHHEHTTDIIFLSMSFHFSGVHKVTLTHLKNDVFLISLPFPLYWGNTFYLPNVITYLVDFLNAYQRFRRLCEPRTILQCQHEKFTLLTYIWIAAVILALLFLVVVVGAPVAAIVFLGDVTNFLNVVIVRFFVWIVDNFWRIAFWRWRFSRRNDFFVAWWVVVQTSTFFFRVSFLATFSVKDKMTKNLWISCILIFSGFSPTKQHCKMRSGVQRGCEFLKSKYWISLTTFRVEYIEALYIKL